LINEIVSPGFRVLARPSTTWWQDGEIVYPQVVNIPRELEASHPELRESVARVADASRSIRGHYRFYSYTDAVIALDPAKAAPPASDPSWATASAAKWAADSIPMVCSSFIWLAVRVANHNRGSALLLELEGNPENSQEETDRHLPSGKLPGFDGI